MNRILLVTVALLCLPVFTKPIQACRCNEYQTPICAQFWRSDAVFIGKVLDITPLKRKPDNVYPYVMVRFMVQEPFRGVSGSRVGVATANTHCDPTFKKGKQYLVYASLNEETDQLFTGMCRGTTLAVDIDEHLKDLRKLRQREAEESISGRIVRDVYEGLPGIGVEVTSNGKRFRTMTKKGGDFSLSLPGPGSFKVRVLVPYASQLTDSSEGVALRSTKTDSLSTFEYDVTLKKSQCSYLQLDVDGTDPRATATVAGNVITETGAAVDTGAVDLINDLDTGPDYTALLKQDGSFRFERVAAGGYHLAINAKKDVPEEFDAPYPRTYYPASVEKRHATTIQVTEGGVIESLVMRVGTRLLERRVSGTAVWKSGRPIQHANIQVYSGDEYVRYVSIDRDGKFNFVLYGDYDYSIEARDYIDEIEGRSQRVKIPQQNSAAVKLVIQRIKR